MGYAAKVVALSALFSAVAASAQNYTPRLEQSLRNALSKVTVGSCPPELMTPMLQYQCEKQVEPMKAHLARLGPVQNITFRGTQQTPQGPAEVYLVKFASGEMLWMVATDPDGKLNIFWSPG